MLTGYDKTRLQKLVMVQNFSLWSV